MNYTTINEISLPNALLRFYLSFLKSSTILLKAFGEKFNMNFHFAGGDAHLFISMNENEQIKSD